MDIIKKNKFLTYILLLNIVIIGILFVYDSYAYNDALEHIRMSYLVSLGKVPYRDFFEHHHLLLWYMFAPIIKGLPQNAWLIFMLLSL